MRAGTRRRGGRGGRGGRRGGRCRDRARGRRRKAGGRATSGEGAAAAEAAAFEAAALLDRAEPGSLALGPLVPSVTTVGAAAAGALASFGAELAAGSGPRERHQTRPIKSTTPAATRPNQAPLRGGSSGGRGSGGTVGAVERRTMGGARRSGAAPSGVSLRSGSVRTFRKAGRGAGTGAAAGSSSPSSQLMPRPAPRPSSSASAGSGTGRGRRGPPTDAAPAATSDPMGRVSASSQSPSSAPGAT